MGSLHDDDRSLFHRDSHYDLNSKIMLTAIISLSVVVVLVTILHVYARCVLRRHTQRRATLRDMTLITSAAPMHGGAREPPKTGLDPSVIASLPVFVYKKMDVEDGDESYTKTESIECSICLSTLENGEVAKRLPNCKHTFHGECIDQWFGMHSTCPVCRTEAEPRVLVPEPRDGVVPPTAPLMEGVSLTSIVTEGTSDGGELQSSAKIGGPSSRLSSFRRILSRERSSRRLQSGGGDDGIVDLERQ